MSILLKLFKKLKHKLFKAGFSLFEPHFFILN
ncbi:uncharacterized protein METZ01_LOCUS126006 [marine metagenome]|uniref:Uncharacterized protein n=1 Tax=marine metagenome TaxID=408172 RepID=A0A381Y928_9ZZZZ